MTGMTKLLCGATAIAALAGCQQSGVLAPSDIKPSKFILGLQDQAKEAPPTQAISAAPVPVETVALPAENSIYDAAAPVYVSDSPAPIYVETTEIIDTGSYVVEDSALTYEQAPATTYVEESAFAADSFQPVDSFATDTSQTEVTYIAADPIIEPVPAPIAQIVETPVVAALAPSESTFIQEPTEALAIEVDIPTTLDGIAPPPVVEADFVPPPVIEESALAPLDAPVLPSTEILESELAPPISEVAAPPRPSFTPIPQPGLSNYGSAF